MKGGIDQTRVQRIKFEGPVSFLVKYFNKAAADNFSFFFRVCFASQPGVKMFFSVYALYV